MEWLINLFKKIFEKNTIKLLESGEKNMQEKNILKEMKKNKFQMELWRASNPEADDGNGYKIIPKIKLKDMI